MQFDITNKLKYLSLLSLFHFEAFRGCPENLCDFEVIGFLGNCQKSQNIWLDGITVKL
jgi:hypothetical protein